LKIGSIDSASPVLADLKQHLAAQRKLRHEQLERLVVELDRIYPLADPPQREFAPLEATHKQQWEFFETAMQQAQARIRQAQERNAPDFLRSGQQFERLYKQAGGVAAMNRAVFAQLQNKPQSPPELFRMHEAQRGELGGLRFGRTIIQGM